MLKIVTTHHRDVVEVLSYVYVIIAYERMAGRASVVATAFWAVDAALVEYGIACAALHCGGFQLANVDQQVVYGELGYGGRVRDRHRSWVFRLDIFCNEGDVVHVSLIERVQYQSI